ncbi:alpha/beta hydrolase [Amycolatopsis cynarae]|uniref:Alpha/beta hydrolase n=1 Tax=Amycolatopsis cynarae TaxID=2995223 RepID=A0ABY7B940_9PSEU|nr:alpha/beta hydrolase [Amycolatopsis sp. HUAS 11-8]WAL67381.1 alpha/beta hydrolase [Amycolatopsis sp. HUAS 11-8]
MVLLWKTAGHRVFAPSLTGFGDKAHLLSPEVGLDTYVEDVLALIDEEELTDVVLVGHSYAGAVISSVAHRLPDRIAHLVYVDSTSPQNGESAIDTLPELQAMIDLSARPDSPWRIAPPPPEMFGITDPADAAWLRTILSDQPVRSLQQPARLGNPAAASIPRTHIRSAAVNAEGITLPPVPAVQPNGSPAQVRTLPTGHDCMITMPDELSELLLKAASGV